MTTHQTYPSERIRVRISRQRYDDLQELAARAFHPLDLEARLLLEFAISVAKERWERLLNPPDVIGTPFPTVIAANGDIYTQLPLTQDEVEAAMAWLKREASVNPDLRAELQTPTPLRPDQD